MIVPPLAGLRVRWRFLTTGTEPVKLLPNDPQRVLALLMTDGSASGYLVSLGNTPADVRAAIGGLYIYSSPYPIYGGEEVWVATADPSNTPTAGNLTVQEIYQ